MIQPFCEQCCAEYYHVEVRTSQIQGGGLGLFAYDPRYDRKNKEKIVFRKGDLIAPYCGEIVLDDDVEHRYLAKDGHTIVCPYMVRMEDGRLIDGALIRGPAVYGNDANGSQSTKNLYKNNAILCEADEFGAYATKSIHQGEEVFVSYGKTYWEGVHYRSETIGSLLKKR